MSEFQNNSAVEALEKQQKDAEFLMAQRDMALKLSSNREFRKLILDEFCIQESARYAHSSADPTLTAEQRADALALAQAGGHLRRWLSIKVRMGDTAEDQMADLDEALAEARAEADVETNELNDDESIETTAGGLSN